MNELARIDALLGLNFGASDAIEAVRRGIDERLREVYATNEAVGGDGTRGPEMLFADELGQQWHSSPYRSRNGMRDPVADAPRVPEVAYWHQEQTVSCDGHYVGGLTNTPDGYLDHAPQSSSGILGDHVRRRRLVRISNELLDRILCSVLRDDAVTIFNHGNQTMSTDYQWAIRCTAGLPADARVVRVNHESMFNTNETVLSVVSSVFDPVPEYHATPEMTCEFSVVDSLTRRPGVVGETHESDPEILGRTVVARHTEVTREDLGEVIQAQDGTSIVRVLSRDQVAGLQAMVGAGNVPDSERSANASAILNKVPRNRLRDLAVRSTTGSLTKIEEVAIAVLRGGDGDDAQYLLDMAMDEIGHGSYRVPVRVVGSFKNCKAVIRPSEVPTSHELANVMRCCDEFLSTGGVSAMFLPAGWSVDIYEESSGEHNGNQTMTPATVGEPENALQPESSD